MEKSLYYPTCAKCGWLICAPEELPVTEKVNIEKAPPFCPMKIRREALEKAHSKYEGGIKEFARLASLQEAEGYERLPGGLRTKIPRVEELILFARKMKYKRLGIAHCIGLHNEARILTEILENKGFEVASICCKVGAVPKEEIGIKPEEKIRPPEFFEPMCNPIAQAEILNQEGVDLAILVGLCLGHDTLFIQHCRTPITVLVVKDRVFGHNPIAGIYLAQTSYYQRLMAKEVQKGD